MKQILFFALKDDFVRVIEFFEAFNKLKYIRVGNYLTPDISAIPSASRIHNLGIASSRTTSSCESYIVCKRSTLVNVRTVVGARGETRYLVDQLINPDTVVLTPGGVWSDEILLHGRMATVSNTAPAQELMKLFQTVVRKHFTKVRAFYVGPHALSWLHAGKRLTISEQSPREFDLAPIK